MSFGSDSRLSRVLRGLPVDLLAVLAILGVLGVLSSVVDVQLRLARFLFGSVLLFVLPGYVLVAVIFPGNSADRYHQSPGGTVTFARGITWQERLALSFGTSVALVPIFAFVVSFDDAFSRTAVFLTLSLFVLLGVAVALVRRLQLSPQHRFAVPVGQWLDDLWTFLTAGDGRDTVVNVVLVVSVLLALGVVGYAVAVPQPRAEYTSVALMTDQGGDLVSSEYPTAMTQGQAAPLVLAVENHRRDRTRYTAVVEFQQVQQRNGQLVVLAQRELTRMQTSLGPGQTWQRPHRITPPIAGDNHRIVYYIYRDDAPENASLRTADDYLYLWVNVSARPPGPSG